jgi:hypothetical protein
MVFFVLKKILNSEILPALIKEIIRLLLVFNCPKEPENALYYNERATPSDHRFRADWRHRCFRAGKISEFRNY